MTSIRGDALHLPFADKSIDCIITSPPYFALRSYQDAGEHYDGQVGSEPTPQAFIDALLGFTEEASRVLTDEGSLFVNLGDKYAGSGGANQSGIAPSGNRRGGAARYNQATGGIPAKSLMFLPERFRIGCVDQLGLIGRAVIVWAKTNGLPESVSDRVRRSHEDWVHLTKQQRYYSRVDEIREPHSDVSLARSGRNRFAPDLSQNGVDKPNALKPDQACNPLGKLPDSVRTVSTEPLRVPEFMVEDVDGWRMVWKGKPKKIRESDADTMFEHPTNDPVFPGLVALWRDAQQRWAGGQGSMRVAEVDHFAAFPSEWPRWLIEGWCPREVCLECGRGRWPVTEKSASGTARTDHGLGKRHTVEGAGIFTGQDVSNRNEWAEGVQTFILGYACECTPFTDHGHEQTTGPTHANALAAGTYASKEFGAYSNRPKGGGWREYHLDGWVPPPSRPGRVLDPFGGTGTTAMVARSLGLLGISLDLSMDYARLARWRIFESGQGSKAMARSASRKQGALL